MSIALSNIQTLATAYNKLNVFKRWFFPGKVAKALKEFSKDQSAHHAALVYQAYFTHTTSFTQWLFSCLSKFSGEILTGELQSLNNSMLLENSHGQAKLQIQTNFEAIVKAPDSYEIVYALQTLNEAGLLTGADAQNNFNTVEQAQADNLISAAQGLSDLNKRGLLTGEQEQAIREKVKGEPSLVYEVLDELYDADADPLNPLKSNQAQANLVAILQAANPKDIVDGLNTLQFRNLLKGNQAQTNFNVILDTTNPGLMGEALRILNRDSLLESNQAQANFDAIAGANNPKDVAYALCSLNQNNLLAGELAQAFRKTVASAVNPKDAALGLEFGNRTGLFTSDRAQSYLDAIVSAVNPLNVIWALGLGNRTGLFTNDRAAQSYWDAIVSAADPHQLVSILLHLNYNGLLTGEQGQVNFNAVTVTHAGLLTASEMLILWNTIPRHLLTQACLDEIIALAATHPNDFAAGQAAITHYVTRLIHGTNHQHARINHNQSTHTASIHATTDLTAWLLSSKYTLSIDMGKQWQAVISAVTAMTPSEDLSQAEIEAAIRGLTRLTTEAPAVKLSISAKKKTNLLALIETLKLNPVNEINALMPTLTATLNQDSQIDLKSFIVWAYEEVNDKSLSMELFTKALYEIQRGYNLNEQGQDEGEDDKPICYGGTANKFCEKLSSFSPLITFVFVDKVTINLKLKQVTRQATLEHVTRLHKEARHGELHALTAYQQALADLNENREEQLYQYVFDKDNLAEVIKAEFDGLYDKEKLRLCIQEFKEYGLPYLDPLTNEKDYQALINNPPQETKQINSQDVQSSAFFKQEQLTQESEVSLPGAGNHI